MMLDLIVRFAAVVCLFVCLGGQRSASFCLPPTLPPNSNDPYYQAFQTVPPASATASKLMTNFLHIIPLGISKRSSYVEDIVVVMDGSQSIGSCEFEKGKKALKHIMDLSSTGSNDVKYAAVTFARSASVNFEFLPSSTAATQIENILYPNSWTNTQAGLAEAKRLFEDSSSGLRVSSRKMVFLVTDGQSNIQRKLTIPKAQALKNIGVDIFVVAVGSYINGIDEMVKVASYPPEDFLFRVENYQRFWNVVKLVIKRVSHSKYTIVNGEYDPTC